MARCRPGGGALGPRRRDSRRYPRLRALVPARQEAKPAAGKDPGAERRLTGAWASFLPSCACAEYVPTRFAGKATRPIRTGDFGGNTFRGVDMEKAIEAFAQVPMGHELYVRPTW